MAIRYWWVNQGQSYREERDAGLLWAPKHDRSSRQRTPPHWAAMTHVALGDIVLHYADQHVRAISTVTAPAVDARRPASLPADLWDADGRTVRVRYREALKPVFREELPESARLAVEAGGPFRKDAGIKLGYLFPLDADFGRFFINEYGDRFDIQGVPISQPELPAEARDDARDMLRRLIGTSLRTVQGRLNVILSVGNDEAIVRTGRSPDGRPVPISEIQHALILLRQSGRVEISPDEVGYRSAFVGAVLLTLPGAKVSGKPPILTIVSSSGDTFSTGADDEPDADLGRNLTFEGDLSRPTSSIGRREQSRIRTALFGSADTSQCALCGQSYPVRFLWAAHIKKRSVCSDEERRDLAHVAMPACLFGCDALFETGIIAVDDEGNVVSESALAGALGAYAKALVGKRSYAFTAGSRSYFDWHMKNVFRG